MLQAARALFSGRLADGERLAEQAVALNRRHGDDADQEYTVQRLALALLRRRPQDAPLDALRDYAARYPALPVWQAMLAQAEWGLRPERARRSLAACARDGFAALQRSPGGLCGLTLLAEPVAALGTPEQVAQLGAALEPHAARNVVMDKAWAAFGPVARPLGVLASAAGRREEAGAPLRAGGRAVRAPGARPAGSSPRSPTGCTPVRRAPCPRRSAAGAPRSRAGSASAGPPRAPTLRPRRRSSPAAPARDSPRAAAA